MFQFSDLREELATYLTEEQVADVSQAYLFAAAAHEGQKRRSGEPYIFHPIEVARILASMHMDYQSIMAAMLHDVIEDTSVDRSVLASRFGEKVAELVDGVSKLDKIQFSSQAEAQAENLRKMMLAMAKDIRVILVKLADRLHNMRTLGALRPDKQRRVALETLEIYAPIANRLGMNHFKNELEDLGFAALYPIRYRVLKEAVRNIRGNRKEIMKTIEQRLRDAFATENIIALSLFGREKHLYSLYKKMKEKAFSFSDVSDVYAFRIIVDKVDACYRVLGVVHNLFRPLPVRFKDYIAIPKANGYQSIHTVVIGPHGVPIEVQIRTESMDRMAENGVAAHWLYKAVDNEGNETARRAREWLKGLLDLQQNVATTQEFIENVKIDLYPDTIYVFTPKGKILTLPASATPVDFAYAVHTDIGNSCVASKIDRKLASLSTRLTNGQTIEVITAPGVHPSPTWLSFVVTGKARSSIRAWLKNQKVEESETLGKRLLQSALSILNVELDEVPAKKLDETLRLLKLKHASDLYQEIGLGNRLPRLVAERLANSAMLPSEKNSTPLTITGTEGMVVSYAKCCHPIPGDKVVGCLTRGRGVVIHHEACRNLLDWKSSPENIIHVQWERDIDGDFQVELRLDVVNKRGMLAVLSNTFADAGANIINLTIDERDGRFNTLTFLITVKDRTQLARTIRHLRLLNDVIKVSRVIAK